MSREWPIGPIPALSRVQLATIGNMMAGSSYLPQSYADQMLAQYWRAPASAAWTATFAEITRGFSPGSTILDALSASLVTRNTIWQRQIEQILSARHSILGFAARDSVAPAVKMMSDTVVRYAGVQTILSPVVAANGSTTEFMRGYSALPGIRYDTFLGRLPGRPSPRRVAVARHAGDMQSGLLVAETLTGPDLAEEEASVLAEEFAEDVLEPWKQAPGRTREALLATLASLDPRVPEFLKGGWDQVNRAGPAAGSTIAHCAVEMIDLTLRAVAPEAAVDDWVNAAPRSPGMRSDRGTITRRARIRYTFRERPRRDRNLAESQIEALTNLISDSMDVLQPAKHGNPVSISVASAYLLSAESALALIVSQID